MAGLRDLTMQLDSLLSQQLKDQQESLLRFATGLGSLCEQDPTWLAAALTGLNENKSQEAHAEYQWQHDLPLEMTEVVQRKRQHTEYRGVDEEAPHRNYASLLSVPKHCAPPSREDQTQKQAGPGGERSKKVQAQKKKEAEQMHTQHTEQAQARAASAQAEEKEGRAETFLDTYAPTGVEVPQDIYKDAQVKRLSFIRDDGTIAKPIPLHVRLLGKRYETVHQMFVKFVQHFTPMEGDFADFINGRKFEIISTVVISLNFLFIMAQAEARVEHLNHPESQGFEIIGYLFSGFYIVELIAKILVLGKIFWIGPDVGWNMFDFAIVTVGVIELVLGFLGDGVPINTGFLRIIRFLRIGRVLRMFSAMRMFKDMKVMVDTLSGSMGIFFFCTVMVGLLMALFSIFFLGGVASYLEDRPDIDPDEKEEIIDAFGTMSAAILTLFMAVSGGIDWTVAHVTIKKLGPVYSFLFLLFVDFYFLAFANVIVSVFCEKAAAVSKPHTEELIGLRHAAEVADAKELLSLLHRNLPGRHGNAHIDIAQFDEFLEMEEVELYLKVRGISSASARRFFHMLCDFQHSSQVDFATFVSALVRLDGVGSEMDSYAFGVCQIHSLHQLKALQELQQHESQLMHDQATKEGKLMHQELKSVLETVLHEIHGETAEGLRKFIAPSAPDSAFAQMYSPALQSYNPSTSRNKLETVRETAAELHLAAAEMAAGEKKDSSWSFFSSQEASADRAAWEKQLAASEAHALSLQKRIVEMQSHQKVQINDAMDAENNKRKLLALEGQLSDHVLLQQEQESALRQAELAKYDDQEAMKKAVEHHKASEEHLRKMIAIQEMELREFKQARTGLSTPGIADMLCGTSVRSRAPQDFFSPRGSQTSSVGGAGTPRPPGHAPQTPSIGGAGTPHPPGHAPQLAPSQSDVTSARSASYRPPRHHSGHESPRPSSVYSLPPRPPSHREFSV